MMKLLRNSVKLLLFFRCYKLTKTFLQIKKVAAKIKVVAIVNICFGDEVAAHKRRNCFKKNMI